MKVNGLLDALSSPLAAQRVQQAQAQPAHASLRLRLPRDKGVADDLVLVDYVSGLESLCGGLQYELSCVSPCTDLSPHLIGLPVELQFVTGDGARHSVCGLVEAVVAGQPDGALATYQLRLRDALAFMDKGQHCRVFRNCNEIDITAQIFDEWRQRNPLLGRAFDYILWNLKTACPPRQEIEQRNESDAAFLRRLWQRRGLAWFFEAGRAGTGDTPAHTLVLFDDPDALQQNAAGAVRYRHDASAEARDVITAWHAVRQPAPGRASGPGRGDPALPASCAMAHQVACEVASESAGGAAADARQHGDAQGRSALRPARYQDNLEYFHGKSGVRDLCIGQWISVSGHAAIDAHPEAAREFVITELRVEAANALAASAGDPARLRFATQPQGKRQDPAADGDGGLAPAESSRGRYSNHFRCVRRGVAIVPGQAG